MKRPSPVCRELLRWLTLEHQNRIPKSSLVALTGQDHRALACFEHALELYATADEAGQVCALTAMRASALAMQESTRYLAKKAIPHVLDWHDEDRVWFKLFPSLRLVEGGT